MLFHVATIVSTVETQAFFKNKQSTSFPFTNAIHASELKLSCAIQRAPRRAIGIHWAALPVVMKRGKSELTALLIFTFAAHS